MRVTIKVENNLKEILQYLEEFDKRAINTF